jgi:hypothetical protein
MAIVVSAIGLLVKTLNSRGWSPSLTSYKMIQNLTARPCVSHAISRAPQNTQPISQCPYLATPSAANLSARLLKPTAVFPIFAQPLQRDLEQ